MKIIFMGTPQFAAEILDTLLKSKHQIVAVVTQPDRPKGRKQILTASPVKEIALANNLPVFQPEKLRNSEESYQLKELDVDLIITAAYGQFIPDYLLKTPKLYAINVHASLLPKYRGGAPIHYAIWKGEQETGISIIEMVKKMDAGDIFLQKAIPIQKDDTVGSMFDKLAVLGQETLMECLDLIENDKIQRISQDENEVIFSPNIQKDEEKINWLQTAEEIDCHVRAFNPFPSTYTLKDGQRIKIWEGKVISNNQVNKKYEPGTIVKIIDDSIFVATGGNNYYAINSWQESGKKRVSIKDYLNGVNIETLIGTHFE